MTFFTYELVQQQKHALLNAGARAASPAEVPHAAS
jgi:hypothetical protein